MSRRKHLQRMLGTVYAADERRQRERSHIVEAPMGSAPAMGNGTNHPGAGRVRTVFIPGGSMSRLNQKEEV